MKLRLIGYWNGGLSSENDIWPDPKDFVSAMLPLDKQKILSYFESAIQMPYAAGGVSKCRFCDKGVGNREFTDGKFLWPEGLPHYVDDHSVKLPDEFLEQTLKEILISPDLELSLEKLEVDIEWWKSKKTN